MGVIRVNYHDIEEIRFGNRIGYGKEGSCYWWQDDNGIVKIYHSFLRKDKIYFDDLKDDKIAFPKDILLYEDTDLIVGYTMSFLAGNNLVDGFPLNLELSTIKKAYFELKELLAKYKDIYMDDMCLNNLFYNNTRSYFSLIDTSRWYPRNDSYEENISDINWILLAALLININVRDNVISNDKYFSELYRIYYEYELEVNKRISGMKYNRSNIDGLFIEFLNMLEQKTSEIKKYKVKTIEDLIVK